MLVSRSTQLFAALTTAPLLLATAATAFGIFPRLTHAVKTTTTTQLNHQADSSTTAEEQQDTCTAAATTQEAMTKFRSVRTILRTSPHWVGDGFRVYPVFANAAFTEELSPLLMFDYAEPKHFPAKLGAPLGVGLHPHRGFETVTVAFQGQVEHSDSAGHSDVIGQGDVQWMTAGRGIVHSEFHSKEFTQQGGVFEMCQLWVNLPKKHKMTKPGYQAIVSKDIPVVPLPLDQQNSDDDDAVGSARIIAGALGDTKGAAKTFTPVQMWDVNLPHAGAQVDLPFPADHNCMVFVRRGGVQVLSGNDNDDNDALKESQLGPQDVALMRVDGADMLRLRVTQPDSSVLILGGEPLNEPIAAQGPFVMNTQDEIHQAISDYRLGKFVKK